MLLQSKQIKKVLAGRVRANNFTTSVSNSDTTTTALTTALSTAGFGGGTVPLTPSGNENVSGVITTSMNNTVLIFDGTTKEVISDGNGNEVYGRLTESGGVYTLSYYSLVGGVETNYDFTIATSIDFEFSYRFEFKDLPTDSLISTKTRNIDDDPKGGRSIYTTETLNITALNTVSSLSNSNITTTTIIFYVNGQAIKSGLGISVNSSGVVNVDSGTLGYNLETSDNLIVSYTYKI